MSYFAENAAHQKNSHLVIGINGFPAKHRQLASDPSPIISEFASFSNDTMTGNNKWDRIAANRIANSTGGFGHPDVGRNILIGNHRTHGNFDQRLPYFDLEIGAA